MKALKLTAALALLVGTQQAFAASPATGNLAVSADVTAACEAVSGTMGFGSVTALSLANNTDVNGTISVTCSTGTSYTITLGDGSNSVVAGERRMSDGQATPSYLSYELYTDSARSTVWNTTNTVTGTGNGASQSHDVYGRILASQQTAKPGSYTDTVTITVSY